MDEQAFLRTILAHPDDDAPRLVYADWLTVRDDPESQRKADFLRLVCSFDMAEHGNKVEWARNRKELESASVGFAPEWIAVVAKMWIENCAGKGESLRLPISKYGSYVLDLVCDQKWENLAGAEEDRNVRHCALCDRNVHFAANLEQARALVAEGHCIALHPGQERAGDDLKPQRLFDDFQMTSGLIMPDPEEIKRLSERYGRGRK